MLDRIIFSKSTPVKKLRLNPHDRQFDIEYLNRYDQGISFLADGGVPGEVNFTQSRLAVISYP